MLDLRGRSEAQVLAERILDNYGTHKTPEVQAWLKHHRRFVPHFIPTSSSWLNLIERWFGELTQKAVRRGVFLIVPDLLQTIDDFLSAWNENPKPFDMDSETRRDSQEN